MGPTQGASQGLIIQNALALDKTGVALGILAQQYWARTHPKQPKRRCKVDRRPIEEKETRYWLSTLDECEKRANESNVPPRLWYHMDRGYDCWPILEKLSDSKSWYTIRATHNRVLWSDSNGLDKERKYVNDIVAHSPVVDTLLLEVKGSSTRKARKAHLSLRYAYVTLRLTDPSGAHCPKTFPNGLWVVDVKERHPAKDEKPIHWMLWTHYPIQSPDDAHRVVKNYSSRWRIEELHRLWKIRCIKN